jgi:hypothetical protein
MPLYKSLKYSNLSKQKRRVIPEDGTEILYLGGLKYLSGGCLMKRLRLPAEILFHFSFHAVIVADSP